MAEKLTPDSFRMPLIDAAYRLRSLADEEAGHMRADDSTAMWVIREEAWREFRRSVEFIQVQNLSSRRRELLGLPVRLTFDDSPGHTDGAASYGTQSDTAS